MNGALAAFAWTGLRLFGLLRAQVLWRAAIGPAWEAASAVLAAMLALAVAPAMTASASVTLADWLVIAVCELLLGSVLGVVLALPGSALLGAAGHGAATLLMPRSRALPALLATACAAGGLAADLHRPLLVALRQTAALWPVGEPARWLPNGASLLPDLVTAMHAATTLALTLATPVLLTSAVLELALRLTGRGAAAPAVDAVRPWLVAAAALVALGAAWAAYPEAWLRAVGG